MVTTTRISRKMKKFHQFREESNDAIDRLNGTAKKVVKKKAPKKTIGANDGDRNAAGVTIQSDEDPMEKTSNEIHIGGIAGFSESMKTYVASLNRLYGIQSPTVAEDSDGTFYIYRTDTNVVLARNVVGFENAKKRASDIRRQHKLSFDQVKFKRQRNQSNSHTRGKSYVDVSRRYNPSKRTYFRGRYDAAGNYHDID